MWFSELLSNREPKDKVIHLPPPIPTEDKEDNFTNFTTEESSEFMTLYDKIGDLEKDNIELMDHLTKMQSSFEETLNKLNKHIDNLELKIDSLTDKVKQDISKEEDLCSTKVQLQNANNYIQDLLKMILGKFAEKVTTPETKISPAVERYLDRKNGHKPHLP